VWQVAEELLRHGATKVIDLQDSHGRSPLFRAAFMGKPQVSLSPLTFPTLNARRPLSIGKHERGVHSNARLYVSIRVRTHHLLCSRAHTHTTRPFATLSPPSLPLSLDQFCDMDERMQRVASARLVLPHVLLVLRLSIGTNAMSCNS